MTDIRPRAEAALRTSLLYPLLGTEDQERFLASGQARSWRAGETIFLMGDSGSSMMIVLAGLVRISHPSPDGRAISLAELRPGSLLGEIALLDGGARSADAVAATNCTLLIFDRGAFLTLLQANWPLTESVLKLVCGRLRSADQRMADFAFGDLPGRLAKALIARAVPAPSTGLLRVADTQSALAAVVGASRESVNRALRKWERAGLVAMIDGRIQILDSHRLQQIAG